MPYAIVTRDKPGHLEVRQRVRDEHLAYLDAHRDELLAAGALIDDDGGGGHGGIIILDTDDRARAEAFIAGDPFAKAGLFEDVQVSRWRKAYFNGERLI